VTRTKLLSWFVFLAGLAFFTSSALQNVAQGQSAGSVSVSDAISRHTPADEPFGAGIMLSGPQ
jgi:hypothetical protein